MVYRRLESLFSWVFGTMLKGSVTVSGSSQPLGTAVLGTVGSRHSHSAENRTKSTALKVGPQVSSSPPTRGHVVMYILVLYW